jgi:hypothetical protein
VKWLSVVWIEEDGWFVEFLCLLNVELVVWFGMIGYECVGQPVVLLTTIMTI